MKKKVLLFLLSASLFSCVSVKTKNIRENILTLKDSYCKAPFKYHYNKTLPSYNTDSILLANKELKSYFTDQSILILNALNSIDEVNEILVLKKHNSIESQLKILHLRSEIDNKVTIALTELDAVAAEFDCEGERVGQIASYVDDLNERRMNRLVIYSIIIGGAASIASGTIKNDKAGSAVDIGAGIAGAALGFLTLKPKSEKVEFIHKRNLLRDIWNEKLEAENFPPFVWYMYTQERFFSNSDTLSIIKNIKDKWLQFNFHNNLEDANTSVLFNDGGIYEADDLHNRTSMLNQMQSATRTINQNVNYLLLDLDKFINTTNENETPYNLKK